ncbi:MAG: ABC transporter substrate-binding protein [Rhodospirillaceae bacterium]|nr:ABC transporter substrate-binding protein [Rhodospirillaceae bacterium]
MRAKERRRFLTGAGAALAAGAVARPAIAQGRRQWTLVTAWPKDFPVFAAAAERLAARIGAASGERLTVKVLPGGELVPAARTFDAVAGGQAEMGHDIASSQTGKHRAFAFFAAIPFGLTADEMHAWLSFGGGQALWDELCAPFGVKPFPGGNAGAQPLGWFKREVQRAEDFRGLKMRIQGLGAEVLRRLGAVPSAVPGGEIAAALRGGEIDAAEWYGPAQDLALGLQEAAKLYYGPSFHRPGLALELVVNRARYEQLPADLRAIVGAAAAAGHADIQAEATRRAAEALAALTARHAVVPRRLGNEVMAALGAASGAVLAEERERADPLGKRIFESFLQARKLALPLARFGEPAFAEARALAYKYID